MKRVWMFLIALSAIVTVNADLPSRESFLESLNKHNGEGEVSFEEKQAFIALLQRHPEITSVLEIGLNRGASAEVFLENAPNIEFLLSFDIADHECVPYVADYFSAKYYPKFDFISGDTRETLPQYSLDSSGRSFDLIFVDGGHLYEVALSDIFYCRSLAHPGTILLIDDYNIEGVQKAVDECVTEGLIKIDAIHPEGWRWIEAHYIFSE